jgi:hypothetical protein
VELSFETPACQDLSLGIELRESLESAVDDWEEMGTRQLVVAAENGTESSGVGSWQMMFKEFKVRQ